MIVDIEGLKGDYTAGGEQGVLFIHGYLGSRGNWKAFADRLDGWSRLAVDLSGCGESPDGVLRIEDMVHDVRRCVAWLHERGVHEVVLMGHSLGGYICALCADVASKLVLLAPLTYPVDIFDDFSSSDQEALLGGETVFVENKGRMHEIEMALIDEARSDATVEAYRGVDIPVLIVHGRADTVVPIEDSRKIMDVLENGRLVEVDGTHSRSDLLCDEIFSFCR